MLRHYAINLLVAALLLLLAAFLLLADLPTDLDAVPVGLLFLSCSLVGSIHTLLRLVRLGARHA